MTIKFKEGVSVEGINKETIYAMSIADWWFGSYYERDLVVTSVTDGVHKFDSKHYDGDAFDMRTWTTETSGKQLPNQDKHYLCQTLKRELGEDYDVVVESTHIHIEYDPEEA